jgi:DNA-binding Lrp family transcriptional regulator
MGRGLSKLQRDILAVLAASARPLPAGEIRRALGLPASPSGRAALSRALRRLAERRELVVLLPGVARPGRGHLYARPHAAQTS